MGKKANKESAVFVIDAVPALDELLKGEAAESPQSATSAASTSVKTTSSSSPVANTAKKQLQRESEATASSPTTTTAKLRTISERLEHILTTFPPGLDGDGGTTTTSSSSSTSTPPIHPFFRELARSLHGIGWETRYVDALRVVRETKELVDAAAVTSLTNGNAQHLTGHNDNGNVKDSTCCHLIWGVKEESEEKDTAAEKAAELGITLEYLQQVRQHLKRQLPVDLDISPSTAPGGSKVVVLCGVPKSGKTALLEALSGGDVDLLSCGGLGLVLTKGKATAENTTDAVVRAGGKKVKLPKLTILDLPNEVFGVKPNGREKKPGTEEDGNNKKETSMIFEAFASLPLVSTVFLFLLDLSEACGSTIEEQLELYSALSTELSRATARTQTSASSSQQHRFVIVLTKGDLCSVESLSSAQRTLLKKTLGTGPSEKKKGGQKEGESQGGQPRAVLKMSLPPNERHDAASLVSLKQKVLSL